MREVLFRGKRIDNGEWAEGIPTYDINGNLTELEIYKGFVNCETVEIDPETVCQYTGLTDKNGRKIFEGDCLGHKENVVEYMCGGFAVSGDRPLSLMAKYNEVVGNIFDKE